MAKQAVKLSRKKRTKYGFQKLKMCRTCHRYSILQEEKCPKCGAIYMGIQRLIKTIFKRRLLTEVMRMLIVVCIAIVAAPTSQAMFYSFIIGSVFCLSYIVLTAFFIKSEYFTHLKKLLRADLKKIASGIQFDYELAKEDFLEERLNLAYEKLREIGDLITTDTMKIHRVRVLNKIALRSDMELELESLIPSTYDKDFSKYALEVLRINRKLITKKCIRYFIHNRDAVEIDFGKDALIAIASTTLRMKLYMIEFSAFIADFLEYFPKELLLRLCRILHANPDMDWGKLEEMTRCVIAKKYRYDPDFKRYVSIERIFTYD